MPLNCYCILGLYENVSLPSRLILKALPHDAIFLATCNAILPLRCKIVKYASLLHFANVSLQIKHSSLNLTILLLYLSVKSRIGLQIARKIASCDSAFSSTILLFQLRKPNQILISSITESNVKRITVERKHACKPFLLKIFAANPKPCH